MLGTVGYLVQLVFQCSYLPGDHLVVFLAGG